MSLPIQTIPVFPELRHRKELCTALAILPVLLLMATPCPAPAQVPDFEPDVTAYETGLAGVYPDRLEGRPTASGSAYDPDQFVAAHRSLRLGSLIKVVDVETGSAVVVRIVDRGPYAGSRIIDVSGVGARRLGWRDSDVRSVRLVPLSSDELAAMVRRLPDDADGTERLPTDESRGPADETTATGGFTVQLGSFSEADRARALQKSLPGSWLEVVAIEDRFVFRVNYRRYGARREAEEDLERLRRDGYDGFVRSVEVESGL
jgi:rare lipoprotein A